MAIVAVVRGGLGVLAEGAFGNWKPHRAPGIPVLDTRSIRGPSPVMERSLRRRRGAPRRRKRKEEGTSKV